jgi:hypothetical protein
MNKDNLFTGISAFLQGISHGMMKKQMEEQEVDKEISKGLKKFEKVQKLVETDPRFQDPKKQKMLFDLMGIKTQEESETVQILKQLGVKQKQLDIEHKENVIAGTTKDDERANKRLKISEDAAARAAQASQFKTQLSGIDKESSNLEALFKKWNDPLAGGIRKQLKAQYGDFSAFYLQKKQELETKRATISAQAQQAAQMVPVNPSADDANIPETQDDDDLFQQVGY